jgi:hypothetical protein
MTAPALLATAPGAAADAFDGVTPCCAVLAAAGDDLVAAPAAIPVRADLREETRCASTPCLDGRALRSPPPFCC